MSQALQASMDKKVRKETKISRLELMKAGLKDKLQVDVSKAGMQAHKRVDQKKKDRDQHHAEAVADYRASLYERQEQERQEKRLAEEKAASKNRRKSLFALFKPGASAKSEEASASAEAKPRRKSLFSKIKGGSD
eukprot:CAMPEP_0175947944 /NCGR_PEP_ID=MMETSP0108-20121206/28173_1 /TAXON_ID=195067 ORGANISM="Goniomonas pacifica, Strain CCMP1869" /NCGR_SAMPLE_ID=MMETSP0108 /ASSEMBLY_ACC=CAM_ASM_000204 /LENGTH=134 /DNA_ID=CAMNT_0017273643 /DNA_START=23 /DNA_END=427 /DNA_ORIENTATION=-